jgi:hypothetical protein
MPNFGPYRPFAGGEMPIAETTEKTSPATVAWATIGTRSRRPGHGSSRRTFQGVFIGRGGRRRPVFWAFAWACASIGPAQGKALQANRSYPLGLPRNGTTRDAPGGEHADARVTRVRAPRKKGQNVLRVGAEQRKDRLLLLENGSLDGQESLVLCRQYAQLDSDGFHGAACASFT